MSDVDALWKDFSKPIVTAEDYIASLRGRNLNVFFMGERVPEPVDNLVIKPSINAMAETFRLASERPELGGVKTEVGGRPVNRFLHVPTKADDLVSKHEMQREPGRRTGTCF
jgi:4-hydroxybutyryl-CoA dehydratase/vinylacetyl-CoA-Delta-isomerase